MTATRNTNTRESARLNELGWAVNPAVPGYTFAQVLRRFQAATLTRNGSLMTVDGEYGPQSEDALFGGYTNPGESIAARALAVALSQVGITEVPPGSNNGPQIKAVLKSVGLGPGFPWCASFLFWAYAQAARQTGKTNHCPKTAGVLNGWALAGYNESGLTRIAAVEAIKHPERIKPGMSFVLKFSSTTGHTGLVQKLYRDGHMDTVEGNTADAKSIDAGSREGVGVFTLSKRKLTDRSLLGFIGYE